MFAEQLDDKRAKGQFQLYSRHRELDHAVTDSTTVTITWSGSLSLRTGHIIT